LIVFVVVYRWRLKPEQEAQFTRDWREVTLLAREKYGSGGSSLFKAHDDSFVAIARWPDRETRQRFLDRRGIDTATRERMNAAIEQDFPPLELDTLHDLWAPI
jgi:heme-degrading monooxygenase HmoA